jgi:alkylated DNA repair dioxygenase AlkB
VIHDLFQDQKIINSDIFKTIPGLCYIPNFIDQDTENKLVKFIDNNEWITDLKRRVQHYGYRYDYKARIIDPKMKTHPIPNEFNKIIDKLREYHAQAPDQVIINEYQPGQGIAPHTDCVPCFNEIISSLSLGSICNMDFIKNSKKISIPLEARCLIVMSADARYKWKHGITARKSDLINGLRVNRSRRISLTFRTVILNS